MASYLPEQYIRIGVSGLGPIVVWFSGVLGVMLLDGSRDGVTVVLMLSTLTFGELILLGRGSLDEIWRETSVVVDGGGVISHCVSAVEVPGFKTEPP